jgi:parallel beta-helix repeat protein
LTIGEGCQRTHVRRNRFLGGASQIYIGTAKYTWFEDNYFYDCAGDSIYFGIPDETVVRGNVFDRTTTSPSWDGAIFVEQQANNLSIIDNAFYQPGNNAIIVGGSNYTVIANNKIRGAAGTGNGIQLSASHKCVVVGNMIDNADYDGILVAYGDYNTIVGNVSTNCGQYGVNIHDSECNKNVVVGNSLLGNSGGAINNAGTSTVVDHNAQ